MVSDSEEAEELLAPLSESGASTTNVSAGEIALHYRDLVFDSVVDRDKIHSPVSFPNPAFIYKHAINAE